MAVVRRTVNMFWTDVDGATANQPVVTQDQASDPMTAETPLIDAMQALSGAGLVVCILQSIKPVGSAPVGGVYGTVLDHARFTFNCANSKQVIIDIVAPLEDIFDGPVNVDLTRTDVQEFIDQAILIAASESGSPVVSLASAVRGTVPWMSGGLGAV